MDTEDRMQQHRRPDKSAAWYGRAWYHRGYLVLVSALIVMILGVDRLNSGNPWGWLQIAAGGVLGVWVLVEQRRRNRR